MYGAIAWVRGSEIVFASEPGIRQDAAVVKIALPEGWAGVAEPLRTLMDEIGAPPS